jgi:predicted PurR-regulated permease PerM
MLNDPVPLNHHPFLLALVLAAGIGCLYILGGFWQAIFWAAVFGILFRPSYLRMVRWFRGRETTAAAVTVLLIFFTVIVPALVAASMVASEAAGLYAHIESGKIDIGSMVNWFNQHLPMVGEWLQKYGFSLRDLSSKLSAVAIGGSRFIGSLALSAGQNVTSFVIQFFLMLYLLFFVLRDGDLMIKYLHRAIPLPDALERELFIKFAEVSRATIKGTLLIGLLQGTLGGIVFAILGIKGAVFWGAVMVILSMLPAVGAGLVWGPAAIFLFATGEVTKGIILVAFGAILIGLADNVLRPILVGRDTRLPDYLVLFSTLGGLAAFGITGFVLGPILAALFLTVVQIYTEDPKVYDDLVD